MLSDEHAKTPLSDSGVQWCEKQHSNSHSTETLDKSTGHPASIQLWGIMMTLCCFRRNGN